MHRPDSVRTCSVVSLSQNTSTISQVTITSPYWQYLHLFPHTTKNSKHVFHLLALSHSLQAFALFLHLFLNVLSQTLHLSITLYLHSLGWAESSQFFPTCLPALKKDQCRQKADEDLFYSFFFFTDSTALSHSIPAVDEELNWAHFACTSIRNGLVKHLKTWWKHLPQHCLWPWQRQCLHAHEMMTWMKKARFCLTVTKPQLVSGYTQGHVLQTMWYIVFVCMLVNRGCGTERVATWTSVFVSTLSILKGLSSLVLWIIHCSSWMLPVWVWLWPKADVCAHVSMCLRHPHFCMCMFPLFVGVTSGGYLIHSTSRLLTYSLTLSQRLPLSLSPHQHC